jgi:Erv1 / Alr family
MSLTMTQSKFNSANQQAYPVQPIVSRNAMPFSKRNFSAMTLSTNATNATNAVISRDTIVQKPQIPSMNRYVRQPEDANVKPKMLWGKPTWFLLHMMAEKIQDQRFQEIRSEILNIIFLICSNLPCPTCATHAKQYLEGIKYQWIQSREQLKQMLFIFHNEVNKRKGYDMFTAQDLDHLYSKANPQVIMQNFMVEFNRKNKSVRLLADDLNRQRIIDTLKTWFNKNIIYFHSPVTMIPYSS